MKAFKFYSPSKIVLILIIEFFLVNSVFSTSNKPTVNEKVNPKAYSFNLSDVKLLDSPFKKAMQLNADYLLYLNPDRLLSWFRKESGLKPKAEVYGGWEAMGIAGHSLGHYLSACAMMYASTGDSRFLERVNYVVDELDSCQKANGNGYVAAIPEGKRVFEEVADGNIRSKGFDLNGVWVPWYTLHKEIAGLLDVYKYCSNNKALSIALKLADFSEEVTKNLTEELFQKMLACEHGGMNEVLAELSAISGNEKYLNLSKRFHHKYVLEPLENREDKLFGLHANTQIPKLIGLARRYEITGDVKDKTGAEFFWDRIVNHHSFVIGGNSFNEYLGEPDKFNSRIGKNTCETCNTYNMLKLTNHLFTWYADAAYAEYYERALYNHILASQNPKDGMTCYFMPLKSGEYKEYSDHDSSFWCCTGTGMENHAKYGEAIYFHDDDDLWINLFIPSELNWKEKGLMLTQQTQFPEDDKINFTINCEEHVELTLNIRYPLWAENGIKIKLNGTDQAVISKPGSYVSIKNTWKNGDIIEVQIPMSLRIETLPDNKDKAAVLYGPIVLAGDLGPENDSLANNFDYSPVMITNGKSLINFIQPVVDNSLTFKTVSAGIPRDVILYPYYKMHNKRYAIYWDTFTEEQWTQKKADYRAELERQKRIEELTIDFLQPGEMQPERDHNMQGEGTFARESWGGKCRYADDGGWFSFDMKVLPDKTVELICTYWGSESGTRNFDIIVDGEKIAMQNLHYNSPDKFFDEKYQLPESLTKGKNKITVRFQPHPYNTAGGLYGMRVVRRDLDK